MSNPADTTPPVEPLRSLDDLPDACPACGAERKPGEPDIYSVAVDLTRYRQANGDCFSYECHGDDIDTVRVFCECCYEFPLSDELIHELANEED